MIHSLSPDFPAAFEKVDHFLLLETFFRGFQRWCPCRTFPGVLVGASSELLGLSPEPQTTGSNCLLNIYLHLKLNVSEVKSPPNPPQTSSPSPDAIFQRTAPPSSNSQEQDGKTMLERKRWAIGSPSQFRKPRADGRKASDWPDWGPMPVMELIITVRWVNLSKCPQLSGVSFPIDKMGLPFPGQPDPLRQDEIGANLLNALIARPLPSTSFYLNTPLPFLGLGPSSPSPLRWGPSSLVPWAPCSSGFQAMEGPKGLLGLGSRVNFPQGWNEFGSASALAWGLRLCIFPGHLASSPLLDTRAVRKH
ncbi:uncharacterized protein LOC114206517 isoform X1 [Eumetopias jubatus]|uniref:uncharacterized protein LOC114206517 isoform X1 n=1 Tax=Eumetopias jubatus TaxID=34886 RepID=UPI001015F2B7|nr:uncharacterized protein LOC114206517 isoform X1 [Eumetopias jubatus]XP_027956168.1 uncharacterized protein LOC114206517 isoform X1 [Eumetopias jubatus]